MKLFALTLALATAVAAQAAPAEPSNAASPAMQSLHEAATHLEQSIAALEKAVAVTPRNDALELAREALERTSDAMQAMPGGNGGNGNGSAGSNANGGGFAVLVAPQRVASAETLAGGCWARVFEQPGFAGQAVTLVGPLEVSSEAAAKAWGGGHSFVVGPGATLVAAKGDGNVTIHPGQSVPDIADTQPEGLFAGVESLRISCLG